MVAHNETLSQTTETSGSGLVRPTRLLHKALSQCSELCPLTPSLWDPAMALLAFLGQRKSAQWSKGTQVRADSAQSRPCPPGTQGPLSAAQVSVTSSTLRAHKALLFSSVNVPCVRPRRDLRLQLPPGCTAPLPPPPPPSSRHREVRDFA